MKIYKVALHELDEFIKSDIYKNLDVKPITPMRAASYLRNPHALPHDYVIYFMRKGNRLIAFRSLFADKLPREKQTFAWLSGSWVNSDFRGLGHSETLFEEAFKDWEGRLMVTNYDPSLHQNLKTEKFKAIYNNQGTCFYLFAKPSCLLKERMKGIKLLLRILDLFVSMYASFKLSLFKNEALELSSIEFIQEPDDECFNLLKASEKSLFNRKKKNFQWIFKFPWVSTADQRFLKNYPFSSYADSFMYHTLKIYEGDQLKSFLFYSIRDKHLKTLYHQLHESDFKLAAKHLINLAATKKLELLTILDPKLANEVKTCKNPFISSKNIDHTIYSSFIPIRKPDKIQSGDGDFIFS